MPLLLAAACGGGEEKPSDLFARPVEARGIDNVARIHDGLYRGGQPDDEGYRWLKEQGFRTVINLRSHHGEKEEVEAHGMTAVSIPLKAQLADSEPPSEEQLREFFGIVLDPGRQPVFFHCRRGSDRTGTMAAIYRIEVDGWTATEAIDEMRHFGYFEGFQDLIDFVRKYEPRGFRRPR